ncbi:hypothetical protein BDQ17DRAFT_1373832 [Cyathus striatus]|nr:hypothetical protein BDQ17DRAFT_1373832 [Cyathus striatus]
MADDSQLQIVVDLRNLSKKLDLAYIAAASSLVYDIARSFTDEVRSMKPLIITVFKSIYKQVKYIWGMDWSLPKLLYILSRYYCPAYLILVVPLYGPNEYASLKNPSRHLSLIYLHSCRATAFIHGCADILVIVTAVDMILTLRVCAIYGNNKRIILLLAIAFIVTISLYISLDDVKASFAIPHLLCSFSNIGRLSFFTRLENAVLGVVLAFHALLFLLTVIRITMRLRNALRNLATRNPGAITPLYSRVICDGTLYFWCIFFSTLVQTLGPLNDDLADYVVPFYFAVFSFSGSHLILDLKRLADEGTNADADTLSRSIFFARSHSGIMGSGIDEEELGI